MVAATASFLSKLRARWDAGAPLDAESAYMATALLRIALLRAHASATTRAEQSDESEALEREQSYAEGTPAGGATLDVLAMMDAILESGHLHTGSMALALLANAAAASPSFKEAINNSGCIGKVCIS
jgi:hypothetical protein